ncbi:BON domain-containing protein [Aliiglaciecola sp. 3_MG-2023]|uniref:BON domain-containing protein n=1 Tax=Aliiglaciecola sp. 3_MG-2023 TaxID=3062644 RepID=UPI0026E1B361|nr:BON domain-containing protein [Aliiglaciecola sp. 3_MG-2023]MDO6692319.1 BON domain-containing protein [Aliiglaciecola sp. 3_MG-2023]
MKRTTCSLIIAAALSTASMSANAENDWSDNAKDAWIDGKAETTLLFNGNLDSFDINTDVNDGVIVLTGKVDTEVDKALAEELMISLDGVEDVDNQLTVITDNENSEDSDTAQIMQTLKDSKVESVVKTRLLFESEVSGTDIEVEVEDGIVTLTGELDSNAERELAVTIAENTDDVKNVVSNLTIGK